MSRGRSQKRTLKRKAYTQRVTRTKIDMGGGGSKAEAKLYCKDRNAYHCLQDYREI